jgi:hypothetical protein
VANIAALDEVGDGADRLLDGNPWVETRRSVDVDGFDAESYEAARDEVLDGRGALVPINQ